MGSAGMDLEGQLWQPLFWAWTTVASGDGLGHGAERDIDPTAISKAFGEHLHLHELAVVGTGEEGDRRRQTLIERRRNRDGLWRRRRPVHFALGRIQA